MAHHVICPSRGGAATRMPVLGDISYVDYHQCGKCNTVSLSPKDGSGPAVPFTLTPAGHEADRRTRL